MTELISDAGLKMLRGFEGFREHAYQDIVGVWTVGYGETSLNGRAVREGDTLPLPAALSRLRARCDTHYGPAVRAALGATAGELAQHQYDACVSLAYNIGVGGFSGSTVAHKIVAGDLAAAGAAFLMWNKAGGHVATPLVRRREAERRCFDRGEYP